MTAILGLNAYHGDTAAGFPSQSAAWRLADAGLAPGEIAHVGVGRDPRANVVRKLLRAAAPCLT